MQDNRHCLCLHYSCPYDSCLHYTLRKHTLCLPSLHRLHTLHCKAPSLSGPIEFCTFCALGARLTSDIISTHTFGSKLPPYKALPLVSTLGGFFQTPKNYKYCRTKYFSCTDLTFPPLFWASLRAPKKFHHI